jgi:elongation factor Ts
MVTTEQVKELRNKTGVSIMQCKRALEEANGDADKAAILLRKESSAIASKKADRELGSGVVQAYIHSNGAVGAMIELDCETDFVAKNEDFKKLAYDIAMHVAASDPQFLKSEDITEDDKTKVREVFEKEVEENSNGKSDEIKEKMLNGKMDAYFGEKVLLEQKFIKDSNITISQLVEQAVQKFGEKTEISRFVKFAV